MAVPEYSAQFNNGGVGPDTQYFELAAELVTSMGSGFERGVRPGTRYHLTRSSWCASTHLPPPQHGHRIR